MYKTHELFIKSKFYCTKYKNNDDERILHLYIFFVYRLPDRSSPIFPNVIANDALVIANAFELHTIVKISSTASLLFVAAINIPRIFASNR